MTNKNKKRSKTIYFPLIGKMRLNFITALVMNFSLSNLNLSEEEAYIEANDIVNDYNTKARAFEEQDGITLAMIFIARMFINDNKKHLSL
jgi:hypothetical protein